MAVKKTTKPVTKTEVVEETIVEETPSTQVTVDANELIQSILKNANKPDNNHAKEYVMCRSVMPGGLNINCKSGNVYEFKEYGSTCEIEYHDLDALVRKHSKHIFNPRIIIEDEDFLNEFPLVKKAYENVYTRTELLDILDAPIETMIREIKAMPENIFEGLRSIVASKIADGTIDSVKKIRALSEIYDSDFNLLSELFAR